MRNDIEKLRFQNIKARLSLQDLLGKKIKDIIGHISYELDSPCFVPFMVVYEDDERDFFDGEHEFPYLASLPIKEDELEKMFPRD